MKGFVGRMIDLVIGAILLIVLLPLLFKATSYVWDQLSETIGIVKYSTIERAMICYYYLCESERGCRDPKFNNFCGPDKIGSDVYEELCSLPSSLGVDGKQCNSFQFPLKVRLEKNEEISKNRLKRKVDTKHILIFTEQTKGGIDWGDVLRVLFPISAFLTLVRLATDDATLFGFHSSYLMNIEEESYTFFGTGLSNLINFAEVKSGTYYVTGSKSTVFGPFIPIYLIFVDHFSRYLSFTSGVCYEKIEIIPNQIIRISVEDEKTENLKDYNYLMEMDSDLFSSKPTFSIKFWNTTNTELKKYTCSKIDCSEKPRFVFKTRKGTIQIEVQKVESSPYFCSQIGCLYRISKFNLTVCRPISSSDK